MGHTQGVCIETIQPSIDPVSPFPCLLVWPSINERPVTGVGVYEDLKTLEETIVGKATFQRLPYISCKFSRLDSAEDRQAKSLDMESAATNPIDRIAPRPIPAFQEEFPISLPTSSLKAAEPAREFIPAQKKATGVLLEEYRQLLHRGVVCFISLLSGLKGVGGCFQGTIQQVVSLLVTGNQ